MIIIGVDPGTVVTGIGIIEQLNNSLSYVYQGAIKLSVNISIPARLEMIYNELDKQIKIYQPEEFAIETAFYGKNIQSALKIGYARGVAMLAAAHNRLPVNEYSPREVKKSVSGNGSATKSQVQYMIHCLLEIKDKEMLFDESDALAIAICHAFRTKSASPKSNSWKIFVEKNPGRIIQ
ncbi:MAG: crossover junction endodeoxyribonuclease RuvC [Ignavibacteria bacterium]